MKFIMSLLVTAIISFGLSYILPGIHIDQFFTALIVALVLAILNAIVKPVLVILTLPITIFTLGLFLFVINAGIILLAARFIQGFKVDGFWWALLFSLLLSILTPLLYRDDRKEE